MKTKSEINTIAGAGSLILWALIIYFIMESAAGCGHAIKPNCVSHTGFTLLTIERIGKLPARAAISHTSKKNVGHVWGEAYINQKWHPMGYDGFDVIPMDRVTNGHKAYRWLSVKQFFRELGY